MRGKDEQQLDVFSYVSRGLSSNWTGNRVKPERYGE